MYSCWSQLHLRKCCRWRWPPDSTRGSWRWRTPCWQWRCSRWRRRTQLLETLWSSSSARPRWTWGARSRRYDPRERRCGCGQGFQPDSGLRRAVGWTGEDTERTGQGAREGGAGEEEATDSAGVTDRWWQRRILPPVQQGAGVLPYYNPHQQYGAQGGGGARQQGYAAAGGQQGQQQQFQQPQYSQQ